MNERFVFIEQDDPADDPVAVGPFDTEQQASKAADGREVRVLWSLQQWADEKREDGR